MAVNPKEPTRSVRTKQDLGSIETIKYNDPAGADKVIIIEPVIKKAVLASEVVGSGKYVKVTGASYTLDLIGRTYDPAEKWQKGDVVAQSGDIYLAMQDNITGAFDATKWKKVAAKQIGPIAVQAGSVVCTGRWHNSVTVEGFLVDDESFINHQRVRD